MVDAPSKTTILLVEDSTDDAKLIRIMLKDYRSANFDVVHTSYLKDALERLKSPGIEAILLDLNLPDSQGFKTLLQIREAAAELPVIILTGFDDEATAVNAVREGAQDYVVKGRVDSDLLGRAISYAIERKKAEVKLRSALREREILLKEIHHRVLNNLQVTCSLLSQQARRIVDQKTKLMFEESRNKVLSMALVHEELYRGKDLSEINFGSYLSSLIRNLTSFYSIDRNKVNVQCNIDNVPLQLDIAVPCGLIINELVSNAFKYGIRENGSQSEIGIGLELTSDNRVKLTVSDSGAGLPADVDIHSPSTSGFEVVLLLLNQIRGEIQYEKGAPNKFTITFPAQYSGLNRIEGISLS